MFLLPRDRYLIGQRHSHNRSQKQLSWVRWQLIIFEVRQTFKRTNTDKLLFNFVLITIKYCLHVHLKFFSSLEVHIILHDRIAPSQGTFSDRNKEV